jgi:DNA-binding NarL/FixJ family response regulator
VKTQTVVLYGGNLVMSSIGARLKEKPEFQVKEVKGLLPELLEKLEAAPPDVILFDLAEGQPHFAISLLRNHPGIMLIGIDLARNKMLVLSGKQSRLLTAEDLMQVMKRGGSQGVHQP